jgi:hypothetical protein
MDSKKPDLLETSQSSPPVLHLNCTQWCELVTKQLDDIFSQSSNKAVDIFVSLAKQQNIISEDEKAKLESHPNQTQSMTAIHNHAKLMACWGLLFLRLSSNPYTQRSYVLFLNHLEQAYMYLDQSVKKAILEQNEKESTLVQPANPPPSPGLTVVEPPKPSLQIIQ